jgi:hypothetical protein
MEIKDFIDTYTKKIDKLLNQFQTQKTIIYVLITFTLLLVFGFVKYFFASDTLSLLSFALTIYYLVMLVNNAGLMLRIYFLSYHHKILTFD